MPGQGPGRRRRNSPKARAAVLVYYLFGTGTSKCTVQIQSIIIVCRLPWELSESPVHMAALTAPPDGHGCVSSGPEQLLSSALQLCWWQQQHL